MSGGGDEAVGRRAAAVRAEHFEGCEPPRGRGCGGGSAAMGQAKQARRMWSERTEANLGLRTEGSFWRQEDSGHICCVWKFGKGTDGCDAIAGRLG